MEYQLIDLLMTCSNEDYQYLINQISSDVNIYNDSELLMSFELYKKFPEDERFHIYLCKGIENHIRYLGSSDIAYVFRSLFSDKSPVVPIQEIINDVSDQLNVDKTKHVSIERKLAHLIKRVVRNELVGMSDREIREYFSEYNISEEMMEKFIGDIKKNAWVVIPIMFKLFGKSVVEKVVIRAIITLIAKLIGKEAAEHAVKALASRISVATLGTIGSIIGIAWTMHTLAGPAYRKTIPIMLYLGYLTVYKKIELLEEDD